MKKNIYLLLTVLVVFSPLCFLTFPVAVSLTGCSTTSTNLAPGGPYSTTNAATGAVLQDYPFFLVDSAFDLAYTFVNNVFTDEYSNRKFLESISPNIKHAIDQVRPVAVDVRNRYIAARAVYIASPSPANLNTLSGILAEMQRAASAAAAGLSATNAVTH